MPESTTELELKIREILQKGDLVPYRLACPERTADVLRIELILYFRKDVSRAEQLLVREGVLSTDDTVRERGCTVPLEYSFFMDDVTVVLEMNSLFGHAFSAVLSHLDRPGGGISPGDRAELEKRVAELESAMLASSSGRLSSGKKGASRKPQKTLTYEEDLINPSEVMLYFQIHPSTLERWTSLAEENGFSLMVDPVDARGGTEPPRGLVSLMETLRSLQIRDLLDLKEYISRNLEGWEDLYEAFETARLAGLFPSENLTPFEFALALMEARRS